jgi:hypothetical protein
MLLLESDLAHTITLEDKNGLDSDSFWVTVKLLSY